jgi:hypothetical protein
MGTEFDIPSDGYLTFDALTLKQFIKDRLNETEIFTDQNYEGSYISTINEIIAYSFHTLLFYLNQTATNSQFSDTSLYDAMNRIVKLIDYKPIGRQTPALTFTMSANSSYTPGLYTIPRYSYVEGGSKTYSFNEDIVFAKTTSDTEDLSKISSQKLLYQGRYKEYPLYTAVGNDNEMIFFTPGDNVIVDHFNVDVYVKRNNIWTQWKRSPTLYLESATEEVFEIRFNENKQYEIKFGNDINGKRLQSDDTVAIYYLQSSGTEGEVGVGALDGKRLVPFSTQTYKAIINNLNEQSNNQFSYISNTQARDLVFGNGSISTYYQEEEDINSIRENAPGIFRSQYRLITAEDYESYIKTNFANLIHDVKAVNNWEYLQEQMKYYHDDIGLSNPNNISNLLYNQLHFADACNFNNVYLTIVPKTLSSTINPTAGLTAAQKELIISTIRSFKTMTSETIILDPVFIASDIGITVDGSISGSLDDIDNTELFISKSTTSQRDPNAIALDVQQIFIDFFDRSNIELGQELDISALTNNILSVEGVATFYTRRKDNNSVRYNGLSMIIWNPVYPSDITLTTKNQSIEYFKYLYLNNQTTFLNKIVVDTESTIHESVEF